MKKFGMMFIFTMMLLALAACSSDQQEGKDKDGIPLPLEVQLEVAEKAEVNEKVTFEAIVTQGEEKIKDADEVEFEVWENGKKEEGEMIAAQNNKDGTYEAEKAFDRDGEFTIQVHVTARGLHTMPKKSVVVGEGAPENHEADEHGDHEEHSDAGHGDHEHGHTEGLIHFMKPETVQVNQGTELMVHLQDGDHPMEKARVRYEIWNNADDEKHDWVDAEENKPGEYTATFEFKATGTHTIQIHVENDSGLHEHEEHTVEVK